ncbi:ATP-binding protein [Candidatus Dojkabacteria bacterium]|nr:ATP-binding protein [Candidatus Dojkabacteria bacterium]
MKIPRIHEDLKKLIKKNKVLLIYGPRRVGKTTLLTDFLKRSKLKYKLDSGENILTQEVLSSQNFKKITDYCRGYELLAIDEAHKIPNIGMGLKIIVDHIPQIAVIATGSSSFELAGQIGEPLVGRERTLMMYPISNIELLRYHNQYELVNKLPELLVYGSYPQILTTEDKAEKTQLLNEIVQAYLLKDILELEKVKGSKVLLDLLRLVAFQVGSEVSLTELGTQLALDYKTVARYLDLFEKSFILFNLRGYSRSLRQEVTKKSKYYFYDNGVMNAIISNFNQIEIRNDIGMLWENFLVAERIKKLTYTPIYANTYFWRMWNQKEIDWIEEREGKLFGYEFKYTGNIAKHKAAFMELYPESTVSVINKENYLDFIT